MENLMKVCSRCKVEKELNLFHFWTARKSYGNECEECFKEKRSLYRNINSEKIKDCAKKYRESGKAISNWREWAKENPIKLKEKARKYYTNNEDKIKHKCLLRQFPSQSKEYQKNRRLINSESIKESASKYNLKRVSDVTIGYSKDLLRHRGFTESMILDNPELIEIQRIIIKTKRLCKT